MELPIPNKHVRKGNAVVYGEEDYDRQTDLSDGDIDEAREAWRKHAPSWARDLPDASDEEE